jgi:hypothetical protein
MNVRLTMAASLLGSLLAEAPFAEATPPRTKDASSYSFTKAPFINPKIINDLATAISDQGDQVVAINLTDSEASNRYACDAKIAKTLNRYPYIYSQDPVESGDQRPAEFGYRYVGRTTSGIDVLFISEARRDRAR